jgi:hypothetical protein
MQVVIPATTDEIRNRSMIREYTADTPVPIMDGESRVGYSAGRRDVSPVKIELMEEKIAETAASTLSACQKAGPKTLV